jgi:nitrogen regulatory protein P-II 2
VKLAVAIIRPHRLDAVRDALVGVGVSGLTATEVKGFGRQKGHTEMYRGAEYSVEFMPKVKIEVAVEDAGLAQVVEIIADAARTDAIGDGKIFIQELSQAVRVRTGEHGDLALQ